MKVWMSEVCVIISKIQWLFEKKSLWNIKKIIWISNIFSSWNVSFSNKNQSIDDVVYCDWSLKTVSKILIKCLISTFMIFFPEIYDWVIPKMSSDDYKTTYCQREELGIPNLFPNIFHSKKIQMFYQQGVNELNYE